jgi:hypothetical protein
MIHIHIYMLIYIYIHINHTYIYIHIYIHTYTYIQIHHTYIHIYIYIYKSHIHTDTYLAGRLQGDGRSQGGAYPYLYGIYGIKDTYVKRKDVKNTVFGTFF